MAEYLSPGVYVEEQTSGSMPISGVGTSTAGFLGQTERGPTKPQLVTNFSEFTRTFGGFDLYAKEMPLEGTYLAYAVRGFFQNGGTRCYVGRITSEGELASASLVGSGEGEEPSETDVIDVTAVGEGKWGGRVAVLVENTTGDEAGETEQFRLTVRYWTHEDDAEDAKANDANPEAEGVSAPDVEEIYDDLSPREKSANYYESRINGT